MADIHRNARIDQNLVASLRRFLRIERRGAAEHAPGGIAAAQPWPCKHCTLNARVTDEALAALEAELAEFRRRAQAQINMAVTNIINQKDATVSEEAPHD